MQTSAADPVRASGGVRPGVTGSVTMPTAKGTYEARCFHHQDMQLEITVEQTGSRAPGRPQ